MSQTLYRKHRPRSFDEIIGQEHVVRTLKNAMAGDSVAHAYLFTGPRGTGKTTIARIFTKALNCPQAKGADVCLKCEVCTEIENGNFIDLVEIDAASNRGIDEIRQLKETVRFSPSKGSRKVYLIDEVHMLTKEAFNALLKTLEEPPSHVVFVLATTEPHKVLATIISRTQRFDFRFLTTDEILGRLQLLCKKENKKLEDDVLKLIVAASGGSARDAESILGKFLSLDSVGPQEARMLLGITDLQKISTFVGYILEKKEKEAVEHINTLMQEGVDFANFTKNLIGYARTLLLMKLSPSSHQILTQQFSDKEKETALGLLDTLTEKQLYFIIRVFIDANNELKYSPIPQLPLELAAVKITTERP